MRFLAQWVLTSPIPTNAVLSDNNRRFKFVQLRRNGCSLGSYAYEVVSVHASTLPGPSC